MRAHATRFFAHLFALITLGSATAAAAGMKVPLAVERLHNLVTLNKVQRSKAADIFAQHNAELELLPASERAAKGIPVRERMRTRIRAFLTADQQKIYDSSPQRVGGGSLQDSAAATARVDQVVDLSDEQIVRVAALYEGQTSELLALPEEQRQSDAGSQIRRSTAAAVRALLTPEQQAKYDANPTGAIDLEERAFIAAFIKSSPLFEKKIGQVVDLSSKGRTLHYPANPDQPLSMKGTYRYAVTGETGNGLYSVSWTRESPTHPIRVTQISDEKGQILKP